jgi:cyclopropane fatty-acyl-phospholipid synthase-like methyltransferase
MDICWYEDWFADEHYLALYRHRNSEEASQALDLIERTTKISKNAAILDLACGAGRHSIGLAKRGYTNITAIDLSPTLLKEAEKTAHTEGVNIFFKKQDMRNFSGQYDLIINLFTSFGYFETDEENEEVILKIGRHLHPKGYFVLDFLNVQFLKSNFSPFDEKILSSGHRIEQAREIRNNRVEKKIRIHFDDTVKEYHESVRLFTLTDFQKMFTDAGLQIKEIFGDYSGALFDHGSSPRLILVAQLSEPG